MMAGLFCLLLVAACGVLWQLWPGLAWYTPAATPRVVVARGALSDFESANIDIYKQGAPSLVQVTNLSVERGDWLDLDVQKVPQGIGSGFVWDTDGHIVTNYHVVDGADAAQVTLADHSVYDVRHVAVYRDQDVAVLTIGAPASRLHPIPIGTSHDLKVGQFTYALGDPFGLDQTMTVGIVSALGRTIKSASGQPIEGVIQTSTAINPGNSGGPLLDSAGRLVGMNTAIVSPSGAFAGIGFAIPVDDINRVVPQLIRHGKIVHPQLDVKLAPDELARHLGVEQGVLILKVIPGSAEDHAGLRGTGRDESGNISLGDVIVAVDGKAVEKSTDLHAALQHYHVGDKVTLTIMRDEQKQDITLTLQE
jgi:S1-C subfamily serine protease